MHPALFARHAASIPDAPRAPPLHPDLFVDDALLAALIVGALVVVIGVVGYIVWMQRSPRRTLGAGSAPPPVYMPHRDFAASPTLRPGPSAAAVPHAAAAAPRTPEAPPLALAVGAERERAWGGEGAGAGVRPRRRTTPTRPTVEVAEPAPSPLTGTLRMLPGRMEVVNGLDQRAEIRFVHTGGIGDQRVTLGRAPGTPYEHVTLSSQTVSREHAAMTFTRDGWTITNLSTTNPLRVNGTPVDVAGAAVLLSDGDLVELGEVVLRFRI